MLKYAVIDVETGGLDPHRHPLIEVAYVLEDGAEEAFSLPFDVALCSPEAMAVNGWGKREFAPEVTHYQAMDILRRDFRDRLLVASPVHFDIGFLEAWWNRNTARRTPWNHRAMVDLKSYACGVLGVMEPLKNSAISDILGIKDTSDHSALADARWTAEMFRALLDFHS